MKLGICQRRSKYQFLVMPVIYLGSYAAFWSAPAPAQSYLYNQSTFATGNSPAAVITGDFNGDGRLDLAVVNQADNTVSVLLGKPDGTFQPQVAYPTGASPNAMFAADFNGDGHLDLAITNSQANSVSILLGNGDGTFLTQVSYPVGNNPDAVLAADFNGDKKIDLAVANNNDGTVSILLSNGDGTFQAQSTVTVGQSPESIATADFNGDGKLDLATANYGGGSVSVLLGNGDGTFSRNDVPVSSTPFEVIVSDFNGDGKADIATADYYSSQIDVLLGKGDGTFLSPTPTSLSEPNSIVAGDFNRDGKIDLAVATNSTYTVDTLFGNGDGTFQPPLLGPAIGQGSVIASGDVNGDGQLDVVATNPSSASVSVFLGEGGPLASVLAQPLNPSSGIGPALAADMNGDGYPDLVAAQSGTYPSRGQLSVLLNTGKGAFQSPVSTQLETAGAVAILVGDFNGDGKVDVALANTSNSNFSVFLGNGDGTFHSPVDTIYSFVFNSFASGYFQGKSKTLDLAVTTTNPGNNTKFLNIFVGNGDGSFSSGAQYPVSSNNTPLVASADFNGDGNADLAVTAGPQVQVYISKGDGTFKTPPASYSVPSLATSIVLGDFNGDGITDIAVGEPNGIAAFLGNGDGTFKPAVNTPFNEGPTISQAADFTGDGKTDLAGSDASGIVVFAGNGDGTFGNPISLSLANTDLPVGAADFNSDGITDLFLPQGGGSPASPQVDILWGGATASVFPGSPNFGQVDVGTPGQPPMPLVLTSIGNVALSVPSIAVTGDFSQVNTCSTTLANEAACQISVTFTPTAPGSRIGTVTITDNSITGPQVVSLTGTGLAPVAGLSPTSLSFGNQLAGATSAAQNVTLSNTGTAALQVASVTISANFTIQTNNCGSSLGAGNNCAIGVSFAPTQLGPLAGTLTVTDNNSGTNGSIQTVSLSGTGIQPAVELSAGGLGFGDQPLNAPSAAQPVTLTNNGTAPLTVTAITVTANFALATGTTCTASAPLVTGAHCQILVTFTPATSGTINGTLTITDNAPGSPQAVALTGIGTAPAVGLSPVSLSFTGQITGTQSAAQTVKLTNTGNQALTLKSIGITGDFKQLNSCGLGLAINANCSISVIFAPTAGGTRSGVITIIDNAGAGAQTVALTGQGEDFTLSAGTSSTSASVAPGGTATYTLAFSPLGGLNQLVQLGCTGAPLASTCTVSPSSFTPSGTTSATVTVKVATSVGALISPGMRPTRPWPLGKMMLTLFGILALAAFASRLAPRPADRTTHRLAPQLATLGLLALIALIIAACGGSGGSGSGGPTTPAGTYSLKVTGTVNPGTANLSHNVTLTLTVQ